MFSVNIMGDSFSINILTAILFSCLLLVSCEKDSDHDHKDDTCCTDDTARMRADMTKDDYVEIEVNPVEKTNCYFLRKLHRIQAKFKIFLAQPNHWVPTFDRNSFFLPRCRADLCLHLSVGQKRLVACAIPTLVLP